MHMKSIRAGVLLASLIMLSVAALAADQERSARTVSENGQPGGAARGLPADPVNGKRVFFADGCFYCHGTTGAGGGIAGPRLAPNPLPLEGVKAKVRTQSGRMPVYSPAVLKDSEIADIVAYLESIPKGKDAQDIPLLNR
jgi:mono/diheme cytochrome c family protein